jgi:Xaa-Pro aminopeptidase
MRIEKFLNHEKIISGDLIFDAVYLKKPENILYFLGFKLETESLLLIPNLDNNQFDLPKFFVSELDYEMASSNLEKLNISDKVELVKILKGKEKFVLGELNKLKIKKLGFEDGYITIKKFEDLKKEFVGFKFTGISDIIQELRMVKDEDEIIKIKEAARLGDIGLQAAVKSFEKGKTELEIAAEAEYYMRKNGSSKAAFETIVASGERSWFPHGTSSLRKIKDGDIITIDIGAVYEGYNSDMTRTFLYGNASKEKAKIINLVNDAHKAVLEVIKAGEKCLEMDGIARNFFKRNDLAEYFIHGLGHGVGIDIHEDPYLNTTSKTVLKENMVVTVEPGIYLPGKGGARTEDLIVIKKNGYECLSKSDIKYY